MDFGRQDRCPLGLHWLERHYHQYDPKQLILVEHSTRNKHHSQKVEKVKTNKKINHLQQIEVEHAVLIG